MQGENYYSFIAVTAARSEISNDQRLRALNQKNPEGLIFKTFPRR